MFAALALGACAGPTSRIVSRQTLERAPGLSIESITAPVLGDGLSELASLQRRPPSPASELRRAYILSQHGDHAGALAALNRVLYAEEPPAAGVEAIARYLRARANRNQADDADFAADIERARELTDDPRLKDLLALEITPTRAAPPPPPALPGPAALAILPRSAWGARAADHGDLVAMSKPYRITIHHTAILSSSRSENAAAAQIFQIQGGHQRSDGWADIGYHYLIDPAGRVWEGRPLRWQGAHAGGDHNIGNIGVCLLGRFLRGADGQEPSADQVVALERLLRHLCGTYAIPAGHIYFHRRFKATECPGPRLEAAVNGIRRRMERGAQS
jgi:hypothetical protein